MHPWKSLSNNHLMSQNTIKTEPQSQKLSSALPDRIIPHKPASYLLNKMANRAYKRYDKAPRSSISTTNMPPIHSFNSKTSSANPEVLFFPGNNALDCGEGKESSGNYVFIKMKELKSNFTSVQRINEVYKHE